MTQAGTGVDIGVCGFSTRVGCGTDGKWQPNGRSEIGSAGVCVRLGQ